MTRRLILTLLVVAAVVPLLAIASARAPFDPGWQKAVVIWDFRKNELMCHGEKAQMAGEEEPSVEVGVDAQGRPIRQKYRLLTYRCDVEKHQIRIWMEEKMDLIREISCHGTHMCTNKGYKDEDKGVVVHCPDGPRSQDGESEGHDMVLVGAEKEAK